ncbi:SAFB-like transcription modulator isoform X1 [Oopsacas minuta]|uniref:SAFB-like transcription modulator isoform X1 n=1 Tax=Oopsacas minuta TaxID=111878 RepID=A0AAV7JMM4_9METZ|nr:SAFB-like transcription modulator isoform X1 [Oopsacas minuta]
MEKVFYELDIACNVLFIAVFLILKCIADYLIMAATSGSLAFGDNLTVLTKKDLVEELNKRNLKTVGTKGVLITRLKSVLKKESQEMTEPSPEMEIPEHKDVSQTNIDTLNSSKEDEIPLPTFISPDYENIDSAQGSPEDKFEDDQESKKEPSQEMEDINQQEKDLMDISSSYFEQIDSMSDTGDQPEGVSNDAEYEVLSDKENPEDFDDFCPIEGDSYEQDMTEFVQTEGGEFIPDQPLPSEVSEVLLYEDEPADLEVIDYQGGDEHTEPIDSPDEEFRLEGQEPISPCDSEEYPVVLQETTEKKENKANSNQSNEDEVILDVGGEKLEIDNVAKKDKFDKYKEVKNQDPECNLWISNLSEDTRASTLKNKFTPHGNVISAKIVANASKSGEKNKFFGYVIMSNAEEAAKCIRDLTNSEIDGKQVIVEIAKATLPNVVSRSGRLEEREKRDHSDRGDSSRSGKRDNFQGRRIILVRGENGQKLVRVRDSNHSADSRTHYSSVRQVREVRNVRSHRSASPRDRRISIDRRNRYSPPPNLREMHSNDPYRRRVVSRDYPSSSSGMDSKNYGSYRGRGLHQDSGYGRDVYSSPRMNHSMRGVGMHSPRSFDPTGEKSRRDEDKRRMVDEIRRHEQLENEIRKREQRDKERLLKQMHAREAVKEQEFRERERQLHEREQNERQKRMMLEEALRSKEKRERELLKEKEIQSKMLQDRERLLAKRDKDAQNLTQLQQELIILEQKQKDEKLKLEQRLKEYQNREKIFEMEQQDRHRKDMEAKVRMDEDQERRMKESKKRYEDMSTPRQTIKRPFEESRREYSEKRVRDDPHSQFYPSGDNQRWKDVDRSKGSAPSHAYRPDSYPKRGAPPQHSTHSSGHGTRYPKQSEDYYDNTDSGSHSYSHATRPYSSRGGHSYRGRNFPTKYSDNERSMVQSGQSKKMRDHSPSPQDRYSYPRSERHSMSGSGSQSHKSHSDSRSGPPSGSSGMGGRQSDRYGERQSSGKSMHRDSSGHGIGEWHSRSYGSSSGQQSGYSEQRPLSFDKLPRPPMPSFSLPPTPVLPGAPGGFMNPSALGHNAAAALLTSFSLHQHQGALRAPFQPNFNPNYRQ